jgi:hypothetical protein
VNWTVLYSTTTIGSVAEVLTSISSNLTTGNFQQHRFCDPIARPADYRGASRIQCRHYWRERSLRLFPQLDETAAYVAAGRTGRSVLGGPYLKVTPVRHFRDYPLTGHARETVKSTRMTQLGQTQWHNVATRYSHQNHISAPPLSRWKQTLGMPRLTSEAKRGR